MFKFQPILLLAALLWTITTGSSRAQPGLTQQPGYGPQGGYIPVVLNDPGMDPYAMVGRTGFTASPMGSLRGGITGDILMPWVNNVSERLWFRAEYLYWVTEGMRTPPLITTSPAGTVQNQAGILGFPNTETLFGGGKSINDGGTSGIRLRAGFFLTPQGAFAIEGEAFGLAEQSDRFNRSGTGATILARPFYDTLNDRETAQLIAFPGLVEGNVNVRSGSELRSYLINGRASLCPTCSSGVCGCGNRDRVDWIIGYRRVELDDSLVFTENLNSLATSAPGNIAISESFRTTNDFNGLQLGIVHHANFRRAWLESMLRVALGNNSQSVRIAGNTAITELGITENFTGGLLAQRSNIGTYERDEFMLIPELGFTLGIKLADWLDATLGYTVLYYPNVVRAGDQIDSDVNPNLIPEEVAPFTGGLRPRFRFIESDYFAHGVSFGAQVRF
ncbi:MAG: BBP7 family outer membrane beta-barrel protein [Planctomycetota bacterium]